MYKLKHVVDGLKLIVAYSIAKILRLFKYNRDIWLIGERKNEAKDNGYHLFKYIRENYKNQQIYYVIDKSSNDLEKIMKFGNVIYYDTFKHYLYYILSNKLILAHLGSCVPTSPVVWRFHKLTKKKNIFIQHGITLSSADSLKYENTKLDMFICGAKPEYDFVSRELGYPDESVKYTGFCRFDNLNKFKVKNQILVMPTWRKWLGGSTWPLEDKKRENELFIESEYFKRYYSLMNDDKLSQLLEKHNLDLIFYPHYEMQKYINLFKSNKKNVIIASKEKYDVQQLLKDSKLLITDYSSVAFDFAYMDKPIIYYQFDEEEYYKSHYSKGYFNYEKDGFGPKIISNIELINQIENYIRCKFNNEKYKQNQKRFFEKHDKNNSERNYQVIKNM